VRKTKRLEYVFIVLQAQIAKGDESPERAHVGNDLELVLFY
jgi:hypothetical protein